MTFSVLRYQSDSQIDCLPGTLRMDFLASEDNLSGRLGCGSEDHFRKFRSPCAYQASKTYNLSLVTATTFMSISH